jgi:hypothetical protein
VALASARNLLYLVEYLHDRSLLFQWFWKHGNLNLAFYINHIK